ncbi:hypothetical protein ABEV34_11525 [Methylorubrum rhodesianum]|jgi:hypothetical protein|uniref:Glycine zipper domain-containing protein n=1 Tax=Methylorubrum rhodesianum TaxID=29427 RepID=A0ABU9Z7A5_9HYPH|nr:MULTISPECIES: hypothetical protein [Methylorubrum]MBY0140233.1 hypothetical protein [Methylorubrum populi]MRI54020.1 hypothetical protein [Methylobacterium sp. DB1607]MBB5763648.1 hypothetical protein [Methylorubrum rhodesianum]MBI1689799.1 hypothetical protein [Methylorubrum sp. DB1722]MBK3402133.1 hypothetical protein [Methylorubrum rhodesianum]
MKHSILTAAVLALGVAAFAGPAEAKGCLKGAVVGGAAGSMAGHGKAGAAAGCAIGHHEANKKDKSGGQGSQQGQTQPR